MNVIQYNAQAQARCSCRKGFPSTAECYNMTSHEKNISLIEHFVLTQRNGFLNTCASNHFYRFSHTVRLDFIADFSGTVSGGGF